MRVADARGFGWLVVAAIAAVACGQSETNAQTSMSARPSAVHSSNAERATGTPLVLEFDLPAEFANGGWVVTGFRVGFFRGNDSNAIRTVDVARDALTVRGRTAQVAVGREQVPQCGDDCVVRVQTLSRAQTSAWSNPVPLTGAAVPQSQPAPQRPQTPAQPRVARTERPRNASPRQRPTGLTPGDIQKYAALSELLRARLPPDVQLDTEVARFRRVQELALAAVISRDYDLPFTTVSRTMAGPPRMTPRAVLTKLRPDVDIRNAIRKSRIEVARLIDTRTSGDAGR